MAAWRCAALAPIGGLQVNPADTVIIAELRSVSEARRLATRPEIASDEEPVATLVATLAHGQAAMGNLYRSGDSVFFWVGAPVVGNGRILGYLIQR